MQHWIASYYGVFRHWVETKTKLDIDDLLTINQINFSKT